MDAVAGAQGGGRDREAGGCARDVSGARAAVPTWRHLPSRVPLSREPRVARAGDLRDGGDARGVEALPQQEAADGHERDRRRYTVRQSQRDATSRCACDARSAHAHHLRGARRFGSNFGLLARKLAPGTHRFEAKFQAKEVHCCEGKDQARALTLVELPSGSSVHRFLPTKEVTLQSFRPVVGPRFDWQNLPHVPGLKNRTVTITEHSMVFVNYQARGLANSAAMAHDAPRGPGRALSASCRPCRAQFSVGSRVGALFASLYIDGKEQARSLPRWASDAAGRRLTRRARARRSARARSPPSLSSRRPTACGLANSLRAVTRSAFASSGTRRSGRGGARSGRRASA